MSGVGSVGDPFVPVLLLSEDARNGAECRDDGLYVPNYEPAVRVRKTGNQALTANNYAAVTFTLEDFDDDLNGAMHDSVSNTHLLVCRTAGKYRISGLIQFDNPAANIDLLLRHTRSAVTTDIDADNRISTSALSPLLHVNTSYSLIVNDTVQILARSAANANVQAAITHFEMERFGD